MPKQYTKQEKLDKISPFSWYHKVDLGDGVITPGYDYDATWEMIRRTRAHLDYTDKRVLDIGSFDGMWAFEAESLGAKYIVATDAVPVVCQGSNNEPWQAVYEKFLILRDILDSQVMPYYNVAPHTLGERLDVVIHNATRIGPEPYKFDIVQHAGVLYHLRNPLYSLSAARNVTQDGGHLLMESAVVLNDERSVMLFNGDDSSNLRFTSDRTSWWCPTITCMYEMLRTSFFEPLPETLEIQELPDGLGRASVLAKATPIEAGEHALRREMSMACRNPDYIPKGPHGA